MEKRPHIILEGRKKAPRGGNKVPTLFGGGGKNPEKRKKDPHGFLAIGKKPPYNNFPVTFQIFLLLAIFRWTLYFSWYFPYFPLCCHISLSLISSQFFFSFDSLTGQIVQKSDPYLVQLWKSYFCRKTLLFLFKVK